MRTSDGVELRESFDTGDYAVKRVGSLESYLDGSALWMSLEVYTLLGT